MKLNRRTKASIAFLVCLSAVLGFVAGLSWKPLSEGELIARVAATYVAEGGGRMQDCTARPGQAEGVWIVVVCQGQGPSWVVPLDRRGRVVGVAGQSL